MTDTRYAQRLLPEWADQDGILLTWPHSHGAWAPMLAEVETVFLAIAREVTARERVLIACYDSDHRKRITAALTGAGIDLRRCTLVVAPSNDTWARDHGPITVARRGTPVLLDFAFNGWGGKYPAELDNHVTAALHDAHAFGASSRESIDLVLEGGAIDTDGAGTLLTTASCMLSGTRNGALTAQEIEAQFARRFGVERCLWLHHGRLAGDDTDGHVDTLARFCSRDTIAYAACDDPQDEHYESLRAMLDELRAMRTSDGQPYRLVGLPLPAAIRNRAGVRLPATHANFLIINDAVLVPTYRDRADALALARLQDCFPGREIVDIDCVPLIQQFGSLHCVTMQLPRGVLIDD